MRKMILVVIVLCGLALLATPTDNNFHAVTNDWRRGSYSNVMELAQLRLAANTNDIVGAYIMKDYAVELSDCQAMSNSIVNLIRVGDTVALPAFTNVYSRLRQGYERYLEHVIPLQSTNVQTNRWHTQIDVGMPMNSEHILELFWNNGMW